MTAKPARAQCEQRRNDTYTHGWASVCGRMRMVYFDLGGHHNLMDEDEYWRIVEDVRTGKLKDTVLTTALDLGHDERGVPVDLDGQTWNVSDSMFRKILIG